MVVEIVMPKMGESIMEGTIIEWMKGIGDSILKDEILLEISTDKVDSEIPSSAEGTIIEILADVNETVEVGKVIAKIDSEIILLEISFLNTFGASKNSFRFRWQMPSKFSA